MRYNPGANEGERPEDTDCLFTSAIGIFGGGSVFLQLPHAYKKGIFGLFTKYFFTISSNFYIRIDALSDVDSNLHLSGRQ